MMEKDMYPITPEMVDMELGILRERQLSDEEELERWEGLDDLFHTDLQAEMDEEERDFLRMMYDEGDTIDNLGLRGYFGPRRSHE